ncbi:hypothetical protein IAR50_002775 [Cryptococcus sp. DSM 104548]
MAEQVPSSREGLDEDLPSGSIPGVFHQFALNGKLDITDFAYHSEADSPPGEEQDPSLSEERDAPHFEPRSWSFQPQVQDLEMPAEEKSLFDQLCHSRVYNNQRRMRVSLINPMPSYATLNEDVLPGVHEVHPISFIEFEIPNGHPQATYDIQPAAGSDDGHEMSVTNLRWPSDAVAFNTEVTCVHHLPGNGATCGSLTRIRDVYITKEPMTILSDLTMFKDMADQVAHETVNDRSVEQVLTEPEERDFPFEVFWTRQDLPNFRSNMTLMRMDRSGNEHPHTTVASYFPCRKSVTRPSAADDCCFASFNQHKSESLSAINFLVPEETLRKALESAAESKRRERLGSSDILGSLCRSEI